MSIVLGTRVTDVPTGFVGMAMARTQFPEGCVQIAVQPLELKDGLPASEIHLNELRLRENDPSATPATSPFLGKIGTDRVTGITGIIVSYTEYLFQAPRVWLQPKGMTKEGKPLDGIAVDVAQLEGYVPPALLKKEKVAGPGAVPRPMAGPRR